MENNKEAVVTEVVDSKDLPTDFVQISEIKCHCSNLVYRIPQKVMDMIPADKREDVIKQLTKNAERYLHGVTNALMVTVLGDPVEQKITMSALQDVDGILQGASMARKMMGADLGDILDLLSGILGDRDLAQEDTEMRKLESLSSEE